MLRSAASKVMWVGRATVFLIGLAVILALLFGAASTALAANGKPFLLGKKNVASAVSTLVKQGPGPALNLVVNSGQPPLKVNSSGKVANLNADKLDNLDQSAFLRTNGKAADADKLDGKVSSQFAAKAEAPGADSTTFDGVTTLTNSVKNVASVSVTVPADGFVIVTGSGTFDQASSVHVNGTSDFLRAFLSNQSGASDFSNLEFFSVPASAPSGRYSSPFSITRMYPVTAGEHTFFLTADKFLGTGDISRANITAIFVKNQL